MEVAGLLAEGLTNREIAGRLYISIRTVTSHLDHIYTKFGLSSRVALADWYRSRDRPREPLDRSAEVSVSTQGPTPLIRSMATRTTTLVGESRTANGWRWRPRYFIASSSMRTGSGPGSIDAVPRIRRWR